MKPRLHSRHVRVRLRAMLGARAAIPNSHHLHQGESHFGSGSKIRGRFCRRVVGEKRPTCIAEPKPRTSVRGLEIAPVRTYMQPTYRTRSNNWRMALPVSGKRKTQCEGQQRNGAQPVLYLCRSKWEKTAVAQPRTFVDRAAFHAATV